MVLLVDKTKSERGYTSTGRLITRVLHTIAETYPINSRFVNTDEWEGPGRFLTYIIQHTHNRLDFNRDHNVEWGRLYEPEDVVIEWHGMSTLRVYCFS